VRWKRLGHVFTWTTPNAWWHSHTMAPSAVDMGDGRIRIYLGCWDAFGLSRIGWIDVASFAPRRVIAICKRPVLDLGRAGTFDENGVFPAHVARVGEEIRLYYTGFQLGHRVRHFNFGGLAIGRDGENFKRVSEVPVLDRADEGLYVRAGLSVLLENGIFHSVYSAGSSWMETGGKQRPCYDVYYQMSKDGIMYSPHGRCILTHDPQVEHGLGRPQVVRIRGQRFVYHTRRVLGMKYYMGCAREDEDGHWKREDDIIGFAHTTSDFDSEMIYFPSVVYVPESDRYLLFYSGNDFGKAGLGVAVLDE